MEQELNKPQRRVQLLNAEVARKIAAGEVIDRPSAIVRELMDNAVDSGADRIRVEISSGGIEKIRVVDNGCGMTKEDLETCAHPHATSKISTETDLLHLTTLGFRGEALSSMAAVSRLEITSGGWKMNASITEDHILTPFAATQGTIVQTSRLFENFPARRQFLKRPASEAIMCRSTFEEKVLPVPQIGFTLTVDNIEKISLPPNQTLRQRFVQTMEYFENEELFHQIDYASPEKDFSFSLIMGEPDVTRSNRKDIFIYVNGRRIQEYSLVQAICYGTQGYFPNGTFPIACLFVQMSPDLVDFNIHPAKREARFKDINPLHHAVSTSVKNFLKSYTVKTMLEQNEEEPKFAAEDFFSSPSEGIIGGTLGAAHDSDSRYTPPQNFTKEPVKYSDFHSKYFPGGKSSSSGFGSNFSRPTSYAEEAVRELSIAEDSLEQNSMASVAADLTIEEEIDFHRNYMEENEDGFHFVGNALGTFLLAEKNGILYIIDQHAAHERILYNQIMSESNQKQALLVPYVIETDSDADDNYLEAIHRKLDDAGYECRKISEGKWEFTAVPIRWKGTEADLKKDVLDRRVSPTDLINAVAASTACRRAVMDGTVLDRTTAESIARKALELPDPHCPHGRPVFTTITRKQLFSLVKRT